MISIQAETPESAWVESFIALFEKGYPVEFNGFFRNETAAIEITNVCDGQYSDSFPISESSIEKISAYLLTGKGDIDHDWSKLYRKRLFEEKNHIKGIIDTLKKWPDCPRAQVTVWKDSDSERSKLAPCLQLLWFKIIDDTLHLHVHMRTSDCYGKLLMNFNEFIAIQKYVADELGLIYGTYVHFIDSLHFHQKDAADVRKLYKKLI